MAVYLGAQDMLEAIILPALMQLIEQQAPNLQIRSMRVPRPELEDALTTGQLDLATDVLLPVSQNIAHQAIAAKI